jgi:hypothetical protein
VAQLHRDEGVAIRIDPESCARFWSRGQPRSVDRGAHRPDYRAAKERLSRVPTTFEHRKAKWLSAITASAQLTRRGRRPGHVRTLLVREPGDLTADQQPSEWRAALVRGSNRGSPAGRASGLGSQPCWPVCSGTPSSSADDGGYPGRGGIIFDSICTCGGVPGPCVPSSEGAHHRPSRR